MVITVVQQVNRPSNLSLKLWESLAQDRSLSWARPHIKTESTQGISNAKTEGRVLGLGLRQPRISQHVDPACLSKCRSTALRGAVSFLKYSRMHETRELWQNDMSLELAKETNTHTHRDTQTHTHTRKRKNLRRNASDLQLRHAV